MAEVIAGFSLAANVLQFIDVSSRLTTTFWRLYKSSSDASDDLPSIETVNADLQQVLDSLQDPLSIPSAQATGINLLVRDCRETAVQLDEILKRLAQARSQSGTKRGALKAALKAVWKETDIELLRERLDRFRSQLTLHLLTSIRLVAHSNL
jgi:hypothetical protein